MNEKYVFISYSSAENAEATLVKNVLTDNGIRCWMAPDSIPIGSSYASEIRVAIENCTVFVLILSERAQKSAWVEKELDSAITGHKIVYPFMIENCKLNEAFDFYLTNVQRHTAFESKSAAMEKMVKEIKALFGATETAGVNGGEASTAEHEAVFEKKPSEAESEGKLPQENTAKKKGKLLGFLKKLSPYSRKGAKDKKVWFALNISTAFWVIVTAIMNFAVVTADYYGTVSNFLELIIWLVTFFGTWHILYYTSVLAAKIPVKKQFAYKLSVFAVCAVLTCVITTLIWFLEYCFIDGLSFELSYLYFE